MINETMVKDAMGVVDLMNIETMGELNKRLVGMMRLKRRGAEAELARQFKIGDRVEFKSSKGLFAQTITGTVKKVNERTLSIGDCSDDGRGWRVAFCYCKKVAYSKEGEIISND